MILQPSGWPAVEGLTGWITTAFWGRGGAKTCPATCCRTPNQQSPDLPTGRVSTTGLSSGQCQCVTPSLTHGGRFHVKSRNCTMFRACHQPNFVPCPHSTLTTSQYHCLGRCGLNGWSSGRLDDQLWRKHVPPHTGPQTMVPRPAHGSCEYSTARYRLQSRLRGVPGISALIWPKCAQKY